MINRYNPTSSLVAPSTLPNTRVEAPKVGTVLGAAILLKLWSAKTTLL